MCLEECFCLWLRDGLRQGFKIKQELSALWNSFLPHEWKRMRLAIHL